MLTQFEDFNGAGALLTSRYTGEWRELDAILRAMPLPLKASDQAGIQGTPIFDPVAANAAIKNALVAKGWVSNPPLPEDLSFLGTDVDFVRRGLLLEAQFSNYPFLLNNVVRSELLQKAKALLDQAEIELLVMVTKGHMFPASNSTLYYEQAINQVRELSRHGVFDIPIRVVGLLESIPGSVPAVWTEYKGGRYSRAVDKTTPGTCRISPGNTERSRCQLTFR